MSLNSLQDNMSRRASSMAAMANRSNNPQEIQAIQKSLVNGVQNGSIQPYVGIPLIQELTQKLTAAKAQMAQSMAGMQQGPQGQQAPPIAEQVMQQAAQESQGLEALPSNLPQEYAGGGIIAFEEGGEVERFQNQGLEALPSNLPQEYAGGGIIAFGNGGDVPGYAGGTLVDQVEAANQMSLRNTGFPLTPDQRARLEQTIKSNIAEEAAGRAAGAAGRPFTPGAYKPQAVPTPTVAPTATPAANIQAAPPPAAPLAPPVASAIPGAGNFKLPNLQTYTPTPATLPERAAPVLTDLGAITKDMDKKTKAASEAAVKASQAELEAMDKPGFEARESRLGKREAAQEKDSAIGRALNLMSLGFGIAGSKERTVAGALGNEGRQGIADLIRGEAANRAAKDKLEDYRDNLEQQKIAAKKGNYQAAQAAGERAADNLFKYTNLNVTASHYGNTEANQRFQLQQQGDVNRATVGNQGEQIKLAGIEQQNRNAVNLSELGLRSKELDLNSAFRNEQLKIMRNKYDSLDPYQAAQLRAKAEERVDPIALRNQLSKQLGLSKVPAPGADKGFDSKFNIMYQNEVASHFNRFLGIGGGGAAGPNPYDGFKLVP